MKVYLVFQDDCNEADCGCYIESVAAVFLNKKLAEDFAKTIYHGRVVDYNIQDGACYEY